MMWETERLLLRPWCEDDAAELYRYAGDPDVALPAGWMPHTSEANSREIIRTILSKPTIWAVCQKDGRPIGNIHLDFDTALRAGDDECELGFWLGKPFWGQGLIPEAARAVLHDAFVRRKVRTVWCGYFDGNDKSRRVQQKLGFVLNHTDVVPDFLDAAQKKTVHRTYLTRERFEMTMENHHRSF